MNIIKTLAVGFILSVACQPLYATTYYIDSELGNDSWSGKLRTRSGNTSTDGPWQSLNRLQTATLAPGDTVELQCGSKWIQTLRLNSSGTADQPITIRSARTSCEVPPTIDGSQRVDTHAWMQQTDTVYKAAWPIEKFKNGGLAGGMDGWSSWSAGGDQKLVQESNCPESTTGCAAFTSSTRPGSIAISNNFLLEGGLSYSGGITLRIPSGVKVKVLIRRGSPPYEAISAQQWISGNEAWQKLNFAFTAKYTVTNARLDMEVWSEGVKIHFKNASLKPAFATPLGAWRGDLPLLMAHHPNRGHDANRPESVYAIAAVDANSVTTPHVRGSGSTYLDIDSDLQLPPEAMPRPGNRLRIRSAPWRIDEVTITSVLGNRLNFSPATTYPVRAGHGYFLLGVPGTLDSPGEWIYNSDEAAISVWTPEGNDPSGQVRVSVLEKGVDLSNRSNIILEGINIRHTGMGIDLTSARNVTIRSNRIVNTVGQGILANHGRGIDITKNSIWRTGGDAIASQFTSQALRVTGNDISESAVVMEDERVWSLPTRTFAAIQAGSRATIEDNLITTSGGAGIWTLAAGNIEKNSVLHACVLINDCGGIYVNADSPKSKIVFNLVDKLIGNTDGVIDPRPHTAGIYLDDLSDSMKVEGNSVTSAEFGIQVHNAYNNHVKGNTFFGNRQYQILVQEQTRVLRADGDIYGNIIEDNTLVPTKPVIALLNQSTIGNTCNFGKFQRNHYSALLSSHIVGVSSAKEPYVQLRFDQWQETPCGVNMASDGSGGGRVINPAGYAAARIVGGNIVPNGNLTAGNIGWSTWNPRPPIAQLNFENCDVVGPCLHRSAGSGGGVLSSPNFSIKKDVWYRVSFDVKTEETGQPFTVLVRRDGWGTNVGYDSLMGKPQSFTGGSGWKRYSFSFKAAKSIIAGDPTTGERGARVDFEQISAGKSFYIANLEIFSTAALETGLNLRMLRNASRNADDIKCPDEDSAPETCANYVRFSDQQPVSWPLTLPALGTEIIFARDPSLVDSDADGIADIQDKCARTAAGEVTDAAGCALGQSPG